MGFSQTFQQFIKMVVTKGYSTANILGPITELNHDSVDKATPLSAPMDPRYPNQNQTKNCWQNYVDYYRCIGKRGEDYEPCKFFFKNYNTLCPLDGLKNGTIS